MSGVYGVWVWWVLCGSFVNLLQASGITLVLDIFQVLFLEEYGANVVYAANVTARFSAWVRQHRHMLMTTM